jgi:DNA primase
VINFTGRELTNTGIKYINGISTPIFEKTSYLFLLDQAAKTIKQTGFAIVVEGNMDAIRMHSIGITNTVAIMGTYLTQEHMETLTKFTNKIILLFDNDKAGMKAIEQSYKSLLPDLFVLVAQVEAKEEAKDPDEYILKYGENHAMDLIEHAQPIELFLIKAYAENYVLTNPVGKDLFINAVKDILLKALQHSKMGTYSDCMTLINQLTGIKEDTLYQLNKEPNKILAILTQEEMKLFDYYFKSSETQSDIQVPAFEYLPAAMQIKLLNHLENTFKQ